ncbi:MAG: SAM-dependent methyltransferase [Methanoregula sp.]|nr:SAM-dependent methyltransferase [Methanoregula sp.]
MRVRAVPREQIRTVREEDWIDRNRSPYAEGDILWVPVIEGAAFDRVIPDNHPYTGRGFFMIGGIAVIHGKKPARSEVEEIVQFRHPQGVVWIESLNEVTRTPATEVLWGDVGEVRHQENGYSYFLDPRRVMFSQGNRVEKLRMAALVKESGLQERIADMFAGIGYFTVPMAGSGGRVHAMEINPVAFAYLERNIMANGLSDCVTASLGDCRALLSGTYNRIIMGHFDAIEMLPSALKHAETGSTIHVHSIGSVEDRITECCAGAGFSPTIMVHKVKKYRPHAWHVVQDVTLA